MAQNEEWARYVDSIGRAGRTKIVGELRSLGMNMVTIGAGGDWPPHYAAMDDFIENGSACMKQMHTDGICTSGSPEGPTRYG
jgi:hypothetical protein